MLTTETLKILEQNAMEIPSQGGTGIGGFLQEAAMHARENTNIIEIGTWLGAGTAQLALGALKKFNPHTIQIHTYDKFTASQAEVEKAALKNTMLVAGEDTLPKVKKFLSGFDPLIQFHKINLMDIKYQEKKAISVYVDDAAKTPELFNHMIKTFSPYWIPEETVLVFMDFHHWRKSPDRPDFKYQKFIVDNNPDSFRLLQTFEGKSGTAFKYKKPLSSDNIKHAYNLFKKNLPSKSAEPASRRLVFKQKIQRFIDAFINYSIKK